MNIAEELQYIADYAKSLEKENSRLRASVENLIEQLESKSAPDNRDELIALVAPHIERWERNYGARLSGDMKEIVRLYKQIKEEGSK